MGKLSDYLLSLGAKPVDEKVIEGFRREMIEKVIPEIIEAQHEQARLRVLHRNHVLFGASHKVAPSMYFA